MHYSLGENYWNSSYHFRLWIFWKSSFEDPAQHLEPTAVWRHFVKHRVTRPLRHLKLIVKHSRKVKIIGVTRRRTQDGHPTPHHQVRTELQQSAVRGWVFGKYRRSTVRGRIILCRVLFWSLFVLESVHQFWRLNCIVDLQLPVTFDAARHPLSAVGSKWLQTAVASNRSQPYVRDTWCDM